MMQLMNFPSKNDISICLNFIREIRDGEMQRYFENYRRELLRTRKEVLAKYQQFSQADWYEYAEEEVFELPFHLSTATMYFHFSIEKLQSFEGDAIADKVPPRELISPDSNVHCSLDTVDDLPSRHKSDRPLYLVAFPDKTRLSILVDGNHRLLQTINNCKAFVEVLWFPPEITVHCLRDDFEKTFYRCIIDAYLYGQTGQVATW